MIKKTVKKSKVEKSEATNEAQEAAVCAEGDGKCCAPECADAVGATAAEEGGACEVGMAQRAHSRTFAITKGKKYHGERLKLLVAVCEKWCLFRQPWNTLFVRDAHALIDLGLLEYVKSDNGYIQVQPTETGIDRYKTIVAGVFGVEVEVA